MNKPQRQRTITTEEIAEAVNNLGLTDARKFFSDQIGVTVKVAGTVIKRISRNESFKLYIQTDSMKVFAEFEKDFAGTFRKGEKVELFGYFQTLGSQSVCINECQNVR